MHRARNSNRSRQALLGLGLALWISACTTAPEYQRVDLSDLLGTAYVNGDSSLVSSADQYSPWWQDFEDPLINKLVEETLANNLSLSATAANVLAAEAQVRAAVGSRWPTLGISAPAQRSFITDSNENRSYSDLYQANLTLSWQADLFGKLRQNQRAAVADYWGTEADQQALVHSLIGSIINQRVQIAVSQQRLDLAQNIKNSRMQTLSSVERRYNLGATSVSAVDVRLARENLASASADIVARQQDLALAQNNLDLLLGRKPGSAPSEYVELKTLPKLDTSLIEVPIRLLDQRPDLRASEFSVIAANARLAVSVADLYPDITLSGYLGWSSDQQQDFFSASNQIGQISAQLSATLFQRGRLNANVDAASAQLDAQAALYANDVLQAIKEVEDALLKNRLLAQRLVHVRAQVEEVRIAEALSRDRYQRGISNLLTLLESERRLQIAEDLLLQLEQQLWIARVDLHLAVGGQWTENQYQISSRPR